MAPIITSDNPSKPYEYRRFSFTLLLIGQMCLHLVQGKTYWRRISEHMFKTGPASVIPVLLVNLLGGAIFTLQTAKQLDKLGAISSVGGAFAIAFCRELAPILTANVVAGQVSSAFAAEIAAMKVTDQIDALYTLRTDPIDYLALPRVIACACTTPILVVFALVCGIVGGTSAASIFYELPPTVFLESVRSFLVPTDLIVLLCKGLIFGTTVSTIGCGWGLSTQGGVKQVGESATAAVVISGVVICAADLLLSLLLFGDIPIG
jgi:phospholipid/cholesterol/gamma-HCH transport system permease protein